MPSTEPLIIEADDLVQGRRAAPIRPSARFMFGHAAHWVALGFGSGLSRIMPGTTGTLFAWLSFTVFSRWLSPADWGVVIVVGYLIGVWACGKTADHMGVHDHGSMVWDEIIAFWLVLLVLSPAQFSTQVWAFIWFRFFDMVKPPPIRFVDQNLKGAGWGGFKDGFGVMFDDILAAFYTLLLFALWRHL